MPTDADIAWLAGLFEGEGSIIHCSAGRDRGTRRQRHLTIKMTDRDIIERAAQVAGAGTVNGPITRAAAPAHYKPIWQWQVSRWEDIERLLLLMLPWFGERRAAAARRLLADPAGPVGSPPKTHCKRGHPRVGPDADLYLHPKTGITHCRPCRRELQAETRTLRSA